jgi:hypothetical protein
VDVLSELGRCGFDRLGDFFDSIPDGMVVRDLRAVPVEIALALLVALHDGFGIEAPSGVVSNVLA